ncbi:hypothetical protein YP72344_26280 [Yersinia pseudotuberculosis]|uniref:LexA family transcriptional regulator n=1 Tax=Yersinia pseudotuberculosis TaxID=633 RepID=UPI002573AECD|nr:S24 family peptidase [Yersinia pseudotuberculosis]BCU91133.1 hypothetical protein YP72344_26280 [Yersinia pseudotuberculosis]
MSRKITEQDKQAALRLRTIWDSKREELGLTQEKAAEHLGFNTQGAVSQYLNAKTPLNTDAVIKFSALLRVEPEEIKPELEELLSYVRSTSEDRPPLPKVRNKNTLMLMDVYAKAGIGYMNSEFPDTIKSIEFSEDKVYELFGRRSLEGIEMINISGDSMTPAINPKDVVFVDTHAPFFDGDGVYVFVFENSVFVKRLQKVKGRRLAVRSDNQAYETFYIEESETHDLRILGKVIRSLPIKLIEFA